MPRGKPRPRGDCTILECDREAWARGWCDPHYGRWRKHGNPEFGGPLRSYVKGAPLDRFTAKVGFTMFCWEWEGWVNDYGYGCLDLDQRKVYAHRWAYEWFVDPIPDGRDVDHRCHNRACVNPLHLRLATRKQNLENLSVVRAKSGYRGVRERNGRWEVRVHHSNRSYYGGRFDTAEEANEAAITLRNELYSHNDLDRRASA